MSVQYTGTEYDELVGAYFDRIYNEYDTVIHTQHGGMAHPDLDDIYKAIGRSIWRDIGDRDRPRHFVAFREARLRMKELTGVWNAI